MNRHGFKLTLIGVIIGAASFQAMAEHKVEPDNGPKIELSGFMTITAGKILSHNASPDGSSECPCYIADYSNYGTYGNRIKLNAESRIGLQANIDFGQNLSGAVQVTAHSAESQAQLQWAYLTYAMNPNWDLQVGRKRIPLYHYSSSQDVGMTIPWVSPPPELYGWEVNDFNGVTLSNRRKMGGFYVTSSIFAGEESVRDGRYMLTEDGAHTDVSWKNILGGDVEVNKDNLTLRAMYLQADTNFVFRDDATANYSESMKVYGVAANLDLGNWFILSEFNTNVRDGKTGKVAGVVVTIPQTSVGVGYRSGKWTTTLNHARYKEHSSNESIYTPLQFDRSSLTIRYELNGQSALKLQLDDAHQQDVQPPWRLNLLRISYDVVF